MQTTIKKIVDYCGGRKRFRVPILCGFAYAFGFPPFNSLLHPAFTLMPLLSFVALIPLFFFVTREPRRRAFWYTYAYCAAMILGQLYWIGFVKMGGVWGLILLGVALLTLVYSLLYVAAAFMFRLIVRLLPRMYIIVFPAVWVLVEYSRAFTDLAFPWSFVGYGATGILPLAQIASFTGVWGLSYIIVFGNVVIWELLRSCHKVGIIEELQAAPAMLPAQVARSRPFNLQQRLLVFGIWVALVTGISIWGAFRMNAGPTRADTARIALMQSHMDQFNWGSNSIDTAVTVSDSMIRIAAQDNPELIVFPESALLSYIDKRTDIRETVLEWEIRTGIPIVLGALDWERADTGSKQYRHSKDKLHVYNTTFLVQNGKFIPYHKIFLVPFSEATPFQWIPMMSRVDAIGGFTRGTSESVHRINADLEIAPYICYEIIFSDFVRRRLKESTNLLVNTTNDGWFGRSSGPYQHAAMAQMRSIENGITLARSANSGISMFVDPYGRILAKTRLYTRDIVIKDVTTHRIITYYTRYGDWFVVLCAILILAGIIAGFIPKKRLAEITIPLPVEEQKTMPVNVCRSERV